MRLLGILLPLAALASGAWAAFPCDNVGQWFTVYNQCNGLIRHTRGNGIAQAHQALCSGTINDFTTCFENEFGSCDDEFQTKVSEWMTQYKARVCADTAIDQEILYLTQTFQCMFNESDCPCEPPTEMCNYWSTYETVATCYDKIYAADIFNVTLASKTMEWAQPLLKRYTKEILRCIRHRIDYRTPCETKNRKAMIWYHLYALIPPGIAVTYADARARWNMQTREGPRSTVAAFGDPHVQVYRQKKAITCASPGWTTLLDNSYIHIRARNEYAAPEHQATSMEEVEIVILDEAGETVARYVASNGNLPPSFIGGKDIVDVEGGEVSVSLWKDDYVSIKHVPIGIAILLGRYNTLYPVLTVRTFNALLDQSYGVLVEGCEDTIDIEVVAGRRKRATADQCTNACADVPSDFTASCVYDCDVTGDIGLAIAADPSAALNDMLSFDAELSDGDSGAAPLGGAVMTTTLLTSLLLHITSRHL